MTKEEKLYEVLGGYRFLTICDNFEYIPIDVDETRVEEHLCIDGEAKDYLISELPDDVDLDAEVLKTEKMTIFDEDDCIVVVLKKNK